MSCTLPEPKTKNPNLSCKPNEPDHKATTHASPIPNDHHSHHKYYQQGYAEPPSSVLWAKNPLQHATRNV